MPSMEAVTVPNSKRTRQGEDRDGLALEELLRERKLDGADPGAKKKGSAPFFYFGHCTSRQTTDAETTFC